MERLLNTLMEYSWGSRTALAELLGHSSPSGQPQAEMWIGAHPSAPSRVATAAPGTTLADRIAAAPELELGQEIAARFRNQLPFLFKVLAVDAPLSLQAHPGLEQARAGYAREERAGIPLSAASRCYKDPNHKPEILCALDAFEAFCGFRSSDETVRLLESIGSAPLRAIAQLLRDLPGSEGVRAAFERLMTLEPGTRASFLDEVTEACRRALDRPGPYHAELRWTLALAVAYPHDMGAAASLLLNLVRLRAGEAVFLPPGSLHTYLKGSGVELMASSDNVLRGGLTSKHVDLPELLSVLDFRDAPVVPVPVREACAHEREYFTPTPDFRLSVIRLRGGEGCRPRRRGPEFLLCVEGEAEATLEGHEPMTIRSGESVFVSASDAGYRLRGDALVYRASIGDMDPPPGETRNAPTEGSPRTTKGSTP